MKRSEKAAALLEATEKLEVNQVSHESSFQGASSCLYYIQKARVSTQVRLVHLCRGYVTNMLTENLKRKPTTEEFNAQWKGIDKKQLGKMLDPVTFDAWEKSYALELYLNKYVEDFMQRHSTWHWISQVKGAGMLASGKVISMIDITKARTISGLWRFVVGAPVKDPKTGKVTVERKTKGQKSKVCGIAKTMMWRLAKSLIRANGSYAKFYHDVKDIETANILRQGLKIVPSSQLPTDKEGKHVEINGFYGKGHVDMRAIRKVEKLFLSHLWQVWRTSLGLPLTEPYAYDKLGHDLSKKIDPWDMTVGHALPQQDFEEEATIGREPEDVDFD